MERRACRFSVTWTRALALPLHSARSSGRSQAISSAFCICGCSGVALDGRKTKPGSMPPLFKAGGRGRPGLETETPAAEVSLARAEFIS